MTCAVSTKEPTQKLEHIYNDVYYGQLVIHHRDGTSPGEVEWSEFVKEARHTGPEFKSGKEKFRQAVELVARFTKRAPQRLEQVVELWRKGDVNEALHFLGLVLTMANSTSHELEQASDIFSNVQTKLGEMMREAKGNQKTMEIKSDQHSLIEALPKWKTHKDSALCMNRLEYKSATLDVCKSSCWEHGQQACTHIVNYYTSTSNCYLCYGAFKKDLLKVHISGHVCLAQQLGAGQPARAARPCGHEACQGIASPMVGHPNSITASIASSLEIPPGSKEPGECLGRGGLSYERHES